MKKNWTMRVGVTLLALTLITSCFVGGTFAKYTTSDSGSDTARVAKFGVTVTAIGNTFATEYTSWQPEYKDYVVVRSGMKDKIIAPGTWGEMTGIQLSGTPEVAVRVSYEATIFDLGDNWVDADGNYYCPLIIKIREGKNENIPTTDLIGTDYKSADEFEAAVKKEIAEYSVDYKPGTNLVNQDADTLTIDWAWAFQTGEDGTNNVKDTFLGDQVSVGKAATVSLEVTTTVTQID